METGTFIRWPLYTICIALNGLNWYWFKTMVLGAIRLLSKKPIHPEDEIQKSKEEKEN